MGLICTLSDEPPRCDLIGNHVVLPLGHDGELSGSYSLLIGFDTLAGGDWEFFFHVAYADHAENSETVFWESRRVAAFTQKSDREKILRALQYGTVQLVRARRPE